MQFAIAKGQEQAFSQLYHLQGLKLIKFSSCIIHSREIAEEVVEDVFVNLWMNRARISEIQNLQVYLYIAVKNRSLNKISLKAKQLITEPFDGIKPEIEALSPDPYSLLITAEILNKMNKVIDGLPPRCKMIFKLVREDGLRYKEIAEILNISVNTIDVQMAIAVKRICIALGVERSSFKKPTHSPEK